MRTSVLGFVIVLCMSANCASWPQEQKTATSFTEAVIEKAISFMPAEQKTKLLAAKKELLSGVKSASSSTQTSYYDVAKAEGNGPSAITEQFRLLRKSIGDKASYSAMSPSLGKLAWHVISLSLPHHTDENALKSDAHPLFDKRLDGSCGSLSAEFDGFQKVDNPSEFAIELAKRANGLLKKCDTDEATDDAPVHSEVFSLAVNSVADCWWTLLVGTSSGQQENADKPVTGNFIGNKRSLKFHSPSCRYLPAEKNRVYFATRDQAIKEGYVPCKVCKP